MAAPRATQFIALRNLARGSHQTRQLSMTGSSKTFASPALERPVHPDLPQNMTGLGAIHPSERPQAQPESRRTKPSVRHFNTSRELKAVKDNSPIDFAFLPTTIMSPDNVDVYHHPAQIRVPIIPTGADTAPKVEQEDTVVVMKPQINVMSADAVYLPMSESSDGHAMNVDFHAMAERVAVNLRRMKVPVEEQAGIAKRIWADMVDDILGITKRAGTAA